MATTYYDSIAGKLTGEFTGDVQSDYMADPLGSVSGYVDGSGNVVNRYWYAPYGAKIAGTGSGADPDFLYRGAWGYRAQNRSFATHDVRARDYDSSSGTWTTVDPMWPRRPAYGYGSQNPVTGVDPSGSDDVYDDFAINYIVNSYLFGMLASQVPVTTLGGCVTVPTMCDVPCKDDFIIFYLSLHPENIYGQSPSTAELGFFEGGVSFSVVHGGWNGLLTDFYGQRNQAVPQQAGQQLCMTLGITDWGIGYFFIAGSPGLLSYPPPFPYQFRPPGYQAQGKVLSASQYTSSQCRTSYLESLWNAGFAGWVTPAAYWSANPYTTTDTRGRYGFPVSPDTDMIIGFADPLLTSLRPSRATKVCNSAQFADWNYNWCCNEGLDYTSHGLLCCCGGTHYGPNA